MKDVVVLQRRLGYMFGDAELLSQALTHSSYDGDKHKNNQRLEYLGDAVLELVITDILYHNCPDMNEGQMTRVRSLIVREESLQQAARTIGLGDFLVLGKGEEMTGGREKSSILADTMEALFGAVYLDGGMKPARSVIQDILEEAIHAATLTDGAEDYKTAFQHLANVVYNEDVSYHLVSSVGAPHERMFHVQAKIGNRVLGEGKGNSKKQAEMEAAKQSILWIETQKER